MPVTILKSDDVSRSRDDLAAEYEALGQPAEAAKFRAEKPTGTATKPATVRQESYPQREDCPRHFLTELHAGAVRILTLPCVARLCA